MYILLKILVWILFNIMYYFSDLKIKFCVWKIGCNIKLIFYELMLVVFFYIVFI